jgi:hypothetical protein
MTPSDNKSNTWHEAAYIPGAFSGATKIYYAFNPTVGSGHTFTANGDLQSGCFMAWSGATTTDPLDQVSAGANSFSPLQPGSVTPSRDGALLVVAVGDVQTFPPVTDSGYTDLDCVITVGGVNYSSADAYFVQSVAAAINPTVTETGSMNLIQVSFLPAASATTHRTGLPLLGVG